MFLSLAEQVVALAADEELLLAEWRRIFGGSVQAAPPPGSSSAIALRLALADHIPTIPANDPAFSDRRGIVDVYRHESDVLLHFHAGALIQVELGSPAAGRARQAAGTVTARAVQEGYLEDITYTSLAPLLRRQGTYLLHAAAARRGDDALLLVGPSGSGKTTAALALLLAGWQLYANDVIALTQRQGTVYAHPTPGVVTVRSHTLHLFPELRNQATPGNEGGARLPVDLIGHQPPVAISAIFFPEVVRAGTTLARRIHRSFALARLLEESLDRWDAASLEPHTALLAALSEQSTPYHLLSGTDIVNLDRFVRHQASAGNASR